MTSEYTVSTRRAGTLTISTEPSEVAIYKCPLLTDSERRFFIDNVEVKSIEFSGSSNCQLFCRCLMHDLSKQFTGQFTDTGNAPVVQRGKETILALHAFSKMTTSCTWLKFAATFFRQGFNVILLDLPGFGRSSIARDVRCPLSAWQSWEVNLLTTMLAKLGIAKVNVIACYHSASIFFNMVRQAPQILGRNHVLHNAIVNSSDLSPVGVNSLIKSFLTTGMRRMVFASFDKNRYMDTLGSSDEHPMDVVARLVQAERFMRQIAKSLGFNQIRIAAISSLDLTEVCLYDGDQQPGIKPIFGLYPAQAFRIYVAQFMAGESMSEYAPLMSLDQAIVTSADATSILPSLPRKTELASSQPKATSYSYGSRIRQMEDQLILDVAMQESEKTFLEECGDDALKVQNELADRLRNDELEDGDRIKSHTVSKELMQNLVSRQRTLETSMSKLKKTT